MIPLIEKEVVERRRWIEREEFTEMLTLAQSAPGPISINSAVFVGYKTLGLGGMITAVLGTVIPSFVVILLVAMFFTDIRENPTVERIFRGIRPAVVSLIVVPVVNMLKKAVSVPSSSHWPRLQRWLFGCLAFRPFGLVRRPA